MMLEMSDRSVGHRIMETMFQVHATVYVLVNAFLRNAFTRTYTVAWTWNIVSMIRCPTERSDISSIMAQSPPAAAARSMPRRDESGQVNSVTFRSFRTRPVSSG